jgi:transposase
MTENITRTAGIDTAKAKLDIAVHGRAGRWRVDNNASGWHRLAAGLAEAGVARVRLRGERRL